MTRRLLDAVVGKFLSALLRGAPEQASKGSSVT
jgi:hypothetical protein